MAIDLTVVLEDRPGTLADLGEALVFKLAAGDKENWGSNNILGKG